MEGEQAHLTGARGGKRSERVCSREERKTSGVVEEGPPGQQRHPGYSSVSRVSHDDRSSAASGLDVADRLTYLEQRMQMQEDEIQLLKMALADVLKRLNISEEHQAAAATATGRRASGAKARPVSLALPSRPPMVTSSAASLKKSSTLPSSSTARNYSPTPPRSGVKSPPGSVKDSPSKTAKTQLTSAASTCKKLPEGSKSKEAAVGVGTRRVTHCKVTMQIYLSPLARKTGSSETAKSGAAVPTNSGPTATPNNPQAKGGSRPQARKTTPSFTLNLQKTTTSQNAAQDTCYKSPTKSPSQYFQICY
ncbi:echinoderm microtubule-associated protein-like 1 isoform X1 [Siniperca chuatsi]|uniref:echinoderm microtubule-associated protein-like 1 isoform X1 n=1 Tax=Siniperca chuatsi TaxID=119488 RepID=UPI001CE1230D|nr:echinoderm microtubule-associated protein-like 1 isoform X1 [Siniperca chuatsi]XP_044026200.1 echinoderm microtubule-associated protein-like 1 isoform X1 [Siniperca chuatsi]